jgi:NADH-quinone oxidoreductase subunit J
VVIVGVLRGAESAGVNYGSIKNEGMVKNLGRLLFSDFLLPFEIVSLLLLAAMVGSVMLAKNHMKRIIEDKKKMNGRGKASSARNISSLNELTK